MNEWMNKTGRDRRDGTGHETRRVRTGRNVKRFKKDKSGQDRTILDKRRDQTGQGRTGRDKKSDKTKQIGTGRDKR